MSEESMEIEYGDGYYTYYFEHTFIKGKQQNTSGHPDTHYMEEPDETFITDIKKECIDGSLADVTGEEEQYVIMAVLERGL